MMALISNIFLIALYWAFVIFTIFFFKVMARERGGFMPCFLFAAAALWPFHLILRISDECSQVCASINLSCTLSVIICLCIFRVKMPRKRRFEFQYKSKLGWCRYSEHEMEYPIWIPDSEYSTIILARNGCGMSMKDAHCELGSPEKFYVLDSTAWREVEVCYDDD